MITKKNKKGWEEEKNCYLKFENERDFLHPEPSGLYLLLKIVNTTFLNQNFFYRKFQNLKPVKNLSLSNFKLQFSFSSAPLVFLFVFTRNARDFTD